MGMMDKLKEMFGGQSEKATQMADTAKQRAGDAGQQAAEHMPGPAADAMRNMSGKAAQGSGEQVEQVEQVEQAKSDMTEEGGHEWEK
ncbi:hypothetical protein ACFYNO_32375 [Kitasatospora sp. NPDC006697]|uniref:hypothetical protein n=1 Tax=Kitasatospora sp. NPDC006697 TaxID=3364020 RepID=UPI0036935FBA